MTVEAHNWNERKGKTQLTLFKPKRQKSSTSKWVREVDRICKWWLILLHESSYINTRMFLCTQKKTRRRMARSQCCDKVGIKRGPWTQEEDTILVSYIHKHGPGNWRSVPANTGESAPLYLWFSSFGCQNAMFDGLHFCSWILGLMRCSKSCRLRWTNYLRPGIKRGNFTKSEEGLIIHLQSLLGNK